MAEATFDPLAPQLPEAGLAPDRSRRRELTDAHAMAAMEFALQWRCDNALHTDCRFAQRLNLWRDLFPPQLEAALLGKPVGHTASQGFSAGELVPLYRDQDCLQIPQRAFHREYGHRHIEPRAGRFYPKGLIAGVRGLFAQDFNPFRVAEVADEITVDLNHPLADRPLTLSARILDIWSGGEEHGGRCSDIADLVCSGGAGMQSRWHDHPTDFWSDKPFARAAAGPDAQFYAKPRLVDHMDRGALAQLERLYQRVLPEGAEVLDLMASHHSHLPDPSTLGYVTGLGMNQEELAANHRLDDWVVQDLNRDPALPYPDACFDTVLCSLSVEYLVSPLTVFTEVNRVLRPGGRFIVSFSNRWFPPKVVRIWEDIHEFERPALVLEYFLRSNGYTDLQTWSMRGLPRPVDDKYADRLALSDPLFAVWGSKP
jgi:SAM-dependent methyltransferase